MIGSPNEISGATADGLPRRVAVTGATGFLGSHLCRTLADLGVEVCALGRNVERGLALEQDGVYFRPVSLDDTEAMTTAFRAVDAVVHAAALSTAWARPGEFERSNVTGTANVIAAATRAGVNRLIYISSPSVVSRAQDQRGITEEEPPPEIFESHYSRTKMAGELLIRQAALDTVILRPKAIYGPGDTAILPRLVKAAASGRLRRIGEGQARTNLTHVSDVVQGIVQALSTASAAGKTYTLCGAEEVRIWELIEQLIARLSLPALAGEVSVSRMQRLASILERVWSLGNLPGEPPLTRYVVNILAYDKTYDISAAKRELGFQPRMPLEQGLEEVIRHWQGQNHTENQQQDPFKQQKYPPGLATTQGQVECDFTLLNAGTVTTRRLYFETHGNLDRIKVPALFAVIEHPREGVILFDTGYTERFHDSTRHPPHCIYALATPVSISPAETAVAQLRARGIRPESVRWIILSHFHPDHYGGLKDFPNATVVCRSSAWAQVAGKKGLAALRAYMLPGHLPEDICARLHLLPDFEQQALGPFARSFDLFNDGSIQLIDLPGHLPGHVGAWVKGVDNREYALVADAVWTAASINYPKRGLHRWLAADTSQRDATVRTLQQLRQQRPEVYIIPSHCPATAELFVPGFKQDS